MRSILLLSVLLCSAFFNAGFSQKTASSDVIVIPVVVHVVYNTSEQNISKEQIRSQIAVLNNDYRKKNKDVVNIPAAFKTLAADSRIEFRLATIDPSGLSTDGIVRKSTSVSAFELDDNVKSSLAGGSDAWNRDQYLNIWVCNLSGGILGYASSPGCTAERDGVVIRYSVFGTTANVRAPYNKGRTTVHEVGHWLGLKHIWGDKACGDDNIADTPPQEGPTRGCPSGVVSTCSSGATGNMYMNFMDFTNDDCLNMFTQGQVNKMHELLDDGGARSPLLLSNKAVGAEEENTVEPGITSVYVYPNPVQNEVNIKIANIDILKGKPLTIYNRLGQVMRQVQINKAVMQINITEMKEGLYFISTGDGKAHKFVKVD